MDNLDNRLRYKIRRLPHDNIMVEDSRGSAFIQNSRGGTRHDPQLPVAQPAAD
jgi:hypothetical protein